MKILITGVGGPTPRSFAISLKNHSFYKRFELIATDINPLAIGLYKSELFSKSYIVTKATSSDYWDQIEKIVKENDIKYAVILPELEVIEWSKRKETHELPCKVLLPDYSIATLLVDKAKMTEVLDELDLVPPSVSFVRDEENLNIVFDELGNDFRSEEHTSELQSRGHLVCRLLLEI